MPDSRIAAACVRPTKLPDHMLTQAEAEKYWLRDRKNLVNCGITKKKIIEFYKKRDSR